METAAAAATGSGIHGGQSHPFRGTLVIRHTWNEKERESRENAGRLKTVARKCAWRRPARNFIGAAEDVPRTVNPGSNDFSVAPLRAQV